MDWSYFFYLFQFNYNNIFNQQIYTKSLFIYFDPIIENL